MEMDRRPTAISDDRAVPTSWRRAASAHPGEVEHVVPTCVAVTIAVERDTGLIRHGAVTAIRAKQRK